MARAAKDTIIQGMRDDVERAAGVIFLDYTGLTVAQADKFRRKLEAAQIVYKVVKNTLMARAVSGTPYEPIKNCFKGTPTGVVLGFEDPVTPAKLTYEFLKECDQLKIKGGIVDGKAIGVPETEALSQLPSKEQLQGSIVALALSPGGKLQGLLKGPGGRIAGAIAALVKRLDPQHQD